MSLAVVAWPEPHPQGSGGDERERERERERMCFDLVQSCFLQTMPWKEGFYLQRGHENKFPGD